MGPDGEPARQSNARFVRWSDGSLQLWLGDEVLDAKEIDIRGDQNFAFVRHQQLIQVRVDGWERAGCLLGRAGQLG